MEFPTEIAHIEEIEEIEEHIVEDDDAETIVLTPQTMRVAGAAPASRQKVVLIQTPQGARRTVRIQAASSPAAGTVSSGGGVQYVKTGSGLMQVRAGGTQRVVAPSTSAAVRASPGTRTIIGTAKPLVAQRPAAQTVTKTITMAEAQQMGLITPTGSAAAGKLTLNPTIKHEGGTVKVVNVTPAGTKAVRQLSPAGGTVLNRVGATAGVKVAPKTVQYIEVAPSGHAVKAEPGSQKKEQLVKVTSQTADRLLQLEGSVVLPGHSGKAAILPSDYVSQIVAKGHADEEEVPEDEALTEMADIVDDGDIIVQSTSPTPNDVLDVGKKRPCNCTRSQCLKLYCECFANGEYCSGCNCKDCANTMDNEEGRQEAIYQCLLRNPNAFRPKIGKVSSATTGLRHHKGCHCKRSGCLKNYCECFEAKIPCSEMCKCLDCKNSDENGKNLRFEQSGSGKAASAIKRAAAAVEGELRMKANEDDEPPPKQPYNFMTADVVDATVQCMMAQADECQQTGVSYRNMERLILEEFGRCLAEIIEFSAKNTE